MGPETEVLIPVASPGHPKEVEATVYLVDASHPHPGQDPGLTHFAIAIITIVKAPLPAAKAWGAGDNCKLLPLALIQYQKTLSNTTLSRFLNPI